MCLMMIVRLLLNVIGEICIYVGIDGRVLKSKVRTVMNGTFGATVVVVVVIGLFSMTFMLVSFLITGVYLRYVPSLSSSRSLNIGIDKMGRLSSKLLLQDEMKVYKYLCAEKNYYTFQNSFYEFSFETPTKSKEETLKMSKRNKPVKRASKKGFSGKKGTRKRVTDGPKSMIKSQEERIARFRKTRDYRRLRSFCKDIKTTYMDTLTLTQAHHTFTLQMSDNKDLMIDDSNNLGVSLTVAYLINGKTKLKKFDSIFYKKRRSFLGSQTLQKVVEWWYGWYTDTYISGEITLDNQSDNLLYISIDILQANISSLQVHTQLSTNFFIYYAILLMPVICIIVTVVTSSNITCILTVCILYVIIKILRFNFLAEEPPACEESAHPSIDAALDRRVESNPPNTNSTIFTDLD